MVAVCFQPQILSTSNWVQCVRCAMGLDVSAKVLEFEQQTNCASCDVANLVCHTNCRLQCIALSMLCTVLLSVCVWPRYSC